MNVKKLVLTNLPYVVLGLVCTNFGEAWRMASGGDASEKILSLFGAIPAAFGNPLPSFHALDLCVGLVCGLLLRLAVYLRGKNAKKYRHGYEYGAARWGTAEDIRPYVDPVFKNNIMLTQTERLTMNSRPKDPKTARNKNVLIVGGSGSGKTRFFIKPNLMQCHSSYVVTDPKGQLVLETGRLLERAGYEIRVLNTINFKKSMHYNPFAYIHSRERHLEARHLPHHQHDRAGQKRRRVLDECREAALHRAHRLHPLRGPARGAELRHDARDAKLAWRCARTTKTSKTELTCSWRIWRGASPDTSPCANMPNSS